MSARAAGGTVNQSDLEKITLRDGSLTMSRKIKRIGCSTLKELLEEDRLQLLDRWTITELMTFVNKGRSFEADRGYHDDMVMTCVLFLYGLCVVIVLFCMTLMLYLHDFHIIIISRL